MKKAVSKRLLALAAALCMIVCMMPAGVKAAEPDTVKYVALGDSITSGYGLTEPKTLSFPALIAADQGYFVTNYGQGGATSATLLASLAEPTVAADVASADVITITIGGNDLMGALYSYIANAWNADKGTSITALDVQKALANKDGSMLAFAFNIIGDFGQSTVAAQAIADFTQNFAAVIGAVRKANPDVLLFVATQYNPYKWLPGQCTDSYRTQVEQITAVFEAGVATLNGVITSAAQAGGAVVVDVYGAFNASEENLSNASYSSKAMGPILIPEVELDFHPNEAGHRVIANTMETAVNTTVQAALSNAAAAAAALGTITVDQKDFSSLEAAQAWAANQIQSLPAVGVSVSGGADKFVPAAAGTAENPAGTDGGFEIVVTFGLAGQQQTVSVPVVIKATAYTAPAKEEDNNKTDDGEKKEENKQQTQESPKATTVKTTSASPKTGDSSSVMPYVIMMLAAAAAAAAAVRRKISGR